LIHIINFNWSKLKQRVDSAVLMGNKACSPRRIHRLIHNSCG
jgi:hypothetical protein